MIKRLLFAALVVACAVTTYAQESQLPKLSPLTKIYLQQSAKYPDGVVPGYVYKEYAGQRYISALLQVAPAFVEDPLLILGVRIGTMAGNIWTAQIPVEKVAAATKIPGIAYLQLDEPMHPTLDTARKYTRVDSVQGGAGLSRPFFGKGVVVGIIDAGFDYGSPSLWDTGGSYYRVKRIWAQKTGTGMPPAGYIYGVEYRDSASMLAAATDQPAQSHGAHVAGIAAGSGYGSALNNNIRFRGMAPLSDIVLVGIQPAQQQWLNTGGSDVIDGAKYIYDYAASVNKPAIINLSWGTSLGAHDGTSLYCQALDNLCGKGKIFATSAGNNGDTRLHINKTFSAADSTLNTFVTYQSSVKATWVDIWGDTAKPFKLKVSLYNGGFLANTGTVTMDGLVHTYNLISPNGDTTFLTVVSNPSEFNGKPHALLQMRGVANPADSICLTLTSQSGTINMWNLYVQVPHGYESPFISGGKPWAVDGDTLQSISDNASAKSVVTVGAYATKTSWRAAGGSYSYTNAKKGAIAAFSSIGPSSDGRMKPEIAAPGNGVISAVNSYDPEFQPPMGAGYVSEVIASWTFPVTGRTQRYAIFSGTSMSSPCASGIIALLLEVNKNLTPQDVKDILIQTAIKDNYTGAAMDNVWGGGKINAYAAMKRVLQATSITGLTAHTLASHVFPNPARGNFNIGLLSDKATATHISVYDIAGRCITSEDWAAPAGYATHEVSSASLPAGAYIVQLSAGDGSTSSMRLILE